MPSRYDLHSHSTASDGTLSPSELVARAAAAGVEVLALTDHDTLDGLAQARQAAAEQGLELVNGVEISVSWDRRTVHIVGLGVSPDCEPLRNGLAGLLEFRDWRAGEIGRRLAKAGIEGALEGAQALSRGRIVSRTHFAHFLVQHGHAKDVRQVFKRFLVSGRPGYVPGQWAGLAEAVAWIRAAGGRAVVAHPARYKMSNGRLVRLLEAFRECGGEGLEVLSGSHTPNECEHMARLAVRLGLLASAGSDYHGPENPWIELGRLPALPADCKPVWWDWKGSEQRQSA